MGQSVFLVLHYQNSVVHPDGIWGQNLRAGIDTMGAVEKSERVLAIARKAGMMVIYVNVAFRPGAPELPKRLFGIVADARTSEHCIRGSWGAQSIDELAPRDEEITIINFNSDAFEGTELELILRANEITELYIIGQVIENAVGTTMRRAANMGYRAILIEDCVSGYSDATRKATIEMLGGYGELISSDEFEGFAVAR